MTKLNKSVLFFCTLALFPFCRTQIVAQEDVANAILSNIEMDSAAFHFTMSGFPPKILEYMRQKSLLDTLWISNPHEKFRKSDYIEKSESGLPTRRLVFWNKSRKNCFTICYEQGGRSHRCVVAQFRTFPKVKSLNFAPIMLPVQHYHNIDSILFSLKQGNIYFRQGVNLALY